MKKEMDSLLNLNASETASFQNIPDALFEEADQQEKEAVVEERKSISYWADARRRFKANKVAMAALGIFILLMAFAFIGPMIVPYSYETQYRSSIKLDPMQHSEAELLEMQVLETYDAVFSTDMIEGGAAGLTKGDYYFKIGKKNYNFTLEKAVGDTLFLYKKDAECPIVLVKTKDVQEDGSISEFTELAFTEGEPSAAAKMLTMTESVFPHVFGTDNAGRDIMARCMFGTRVSLSVGVVAAILVLLIGATIGAIAGLAGGAVDFLIMRLIDVISSIPTTLLILLLQVVMSDPLKLLFESSNLSFVKALSHLGVGLVSIFIVFALLYWTGMARIIRGQVLQLKGQEFITAEHVLGADNKRIILKHLLPNCVGQLVINTCLMVPSAIFTESFLSYLGIGVAAPMASLGSMCSDALGTLSIYPYRLLCPALILSVLVLSLNLIGDGLRDALDPRLK